MKPFAKFSRASFEPRRLARSKLLWSLGGLLLLYTVIGFVVVPYLIERNLPGLAQERLGRKATIEKVRINPFALTFEASGFFLQEKADKPLLAFKRLYVNLQLSSLFGAWSFDEVRLEGANLGLEIDREQRLNLLEVIRRLMKPPKPDEPATRVVVSKLVVADGRVDITDLSGASRADASFAPIDFELSNLSTLADQQGQFHLEARLPAGGALAWKGRLSLEPIASAGELSIRGLKLDSAWRFRRAGLNIARPAGTLSIAGNYALDYKPGHTTLLIDRVQAELANLSLAAAEKEEPALQLKSIKVSDASFAYPKGELVVKKLVLADGIVNATVSDTGVLNWQRLAPAGAPPEAPAQPAPAVAPKPAPASPQQPWHIQLASVAIQNVALNYVDRSKQPALAVSAKALNARFKIDVASGTKAEHVVVDDIAVALQNITAAAPGSATRFASVDSLKVAGGRIDVTERAIHAKLFELSKGDLALAMGAQGPEGLIKAFSSPPAANTQPESASAPWRVQVDKVGIDKLAIQYDDKSRAPGYAFRAGELNVGFGLDVSTGGKDARTLAKDLEVGIDKLRLSAQGTDVPLATLDSFRLSSGQVDTGKRTASVKAIALNGGGVRVARGADGNLELMNVLGLNDTKSAAAAKPAAASPAWRYQVEGIDVKRYAVALSDASFTPAIAYDVEIASMTASNVDAAGQKPMAFKAALRLGKDGAASAEGRLRQDFSGAAAQVELTRFALVPLQPILARYAALDLKSGNLAANARVTYARGRKPELTARGQIALADVLINEAATNERFAAWKTLAIDGADLSLSPDKLAIREVRMIEPQAKIFIAKDRSVNLTKVLRTSESPPAAPATSANAKPAAPPPPAANSAPAFGYEIETIRIEKGLLDFADLSLVLPFATQVQALDGAIVGISSDPDARARIKLAGQVDKYGEAHADGSLIPRNTTKFMDITARFDNVDMGNLTPYSVTFAGRKIAEGKLNLVLEYKIVNSELAGENKIVLRDFKLGERVETPGASDLPLDLAIALLKDSDGRIVLAVPVRGNVDDPKFDYSKVIWSAIGNVLTRIVTAPFRMLGALFGGKGDSDASGTVSFAPGSASIAPAQREQLDRLPKALQSRPQLKLVVKGPYDPAKDARELKRAEARLDLARTIGTKIEPGAEPGPIAFESAETQRALEKLLAQRAGPNAIAELEKSFAKRAGRAPDRVNPVLGLIGRGSKDSEFYEAVYERLAEATPLPEGAVRALADKRAQAIVAALEKAGINKAQVSTGPVTQVQADAEKGVVTELSFEAIAGKT